MNDIERCISEWLDRVNERDATIAARREALERVLEQWVNGRKVKDGICMEVLVAAKAALTPAAGGQDE